jgi:hypothetical protein
MAIAVAVAAIVTGSHDLVIPWVPLHGSDQTFLLLGLGALGLLCVLLAVADKFRILLFAFSIHTVYMLVKGFFANPTYSFAGPDDARNALILTAAAFLASIGSWPASPERKRR